MKIFSKKTKHTSEEATPSVTTTSVVVTPLLPIPAPDTYLVCPSFEEEPWRSRAAALRPKSLDAYTIDLTNAAAPNLPPLPVHDPYVELILEFLNSIPKECWVDEDNEED